jgi:hypothetical protein
VTGFHEKGMKMQKNIETTINKTVDNKRVPVGKVSFVCPTIEFFGLNGETITDEEGEVSYKDNKLQWLQKAIESTVRATLTSRLVPNSTEYKKGFSAWKSVEDFFASLGASEKGAHFKLAAQFREAFRQWAVSQKWSAGKHNLIVSLLDEKALTTTSENNKSKMAVILGSFADSLTEEQAAAFDGLLTTLSEACDTAGEIED